MCLKILLRELPGGSTVSKAHRGKGLHETYNRGRGTCPMCKKTGVKVVYEYEIDGAKQNICKVCKATIANKKAKQVAELSNEASESPAETE